MDQPFRYVLLEQFHCGELYVAGARVIGKMVQVEPGLRKYGEWFECLATSNTEHWYVGGTYPLNPANVRELYDANTLPGDPEFDPERKKIGDYGEWERTGLMGIELLGAWERVTWISEKRAKALLMLEAL